MNRLRIAGAGIFLFIFLSTPGWCQPRLPHGPSDQEILMLPEECRILLKGSQQQQKLFYQKFPGLVGPNHYCWGMNFVNRAKFSSLNKTEKRFNLQSAIGEFEYVLKHSAPNANGLQHIKTQQDMAKTMLKML